MRWQLARKTQNPSTRPSSMSLVATGACPCPRATEKNLSPKSFSAASLLRLSVGSTPGERTKIRGFLLSDSLYTSCRSSTGGSTNFLPRELATKVVAAKMTLSGLSERIRIIFCSSEHLDSHSPGSSQTSSSEFLYHSSQIIGFCWKEDTMSLKLGRFSSSVMLSQASSLIHVGAGFSTCSALSSTWPPLRKNCHSSLLIWFDFCKILTQICSDKSILCFSKSPLLVYLYTAYVW
mmetsp:Transcript_6243/g.22317  ORF Transcript_6243/g.22317 Transcript_6243/m.22317 type:complete len:235 (+) Transcript_6243:1667-2371(+)